MDIRQLRYFISIAEQGGFTQGARHLHVAQPALSHHIGQLEKELNVQLLERHARGARLTESGECLLNHARLVLRQMEVAREEVADTASNARGIVRIGLATAASMAIAIPILEAATKRLPEIEIKIVETMSGFLKEWVLNGRLDIAVLYNVDAREGFIVEPLLNENLYLVMPSDADLPGESVRFASLADFPLILPSTAHGLRLLVDSFAAARGVTLQVALDLDSTTQIVKMVALGRGYSILSPAAVKDAVQHGEVRVLRIVEPEVTRSIVLASSCDRASTRTIDTVRNLIVEVVHQLVINEKW